MNRQNQTSQKSTRQAGLLIAASAALSALIIFLCLFGKACPPMGFGDIPDPQETVCGYFDALVQNRFADCDKYLMDFSTAEMAQQPQTEAGRKLRVLLTDSYSYQLSGESMTEGMDALQNVSVTYLDLERFAAAVKEQANALSEELNFLGEDVFTEEAALEIAVQAIDSLSGDAQEYFCSSEITVELRWNGTQWLILYNPELEKMIMGVGGSEQ